MISDVNFSNLFIHLVLFMKKSERIIRDTELKVEYAIRRLRWQQLYDFCKNLNEDKICKFHVFIETVVII